jgi:uncharacterized protein with PIN domain
MAIAEFRFYEELNDFLPRERRKCAFDYRCARRATVKQAIEALGVPHTEVELILVNGESVDFSHLVSDGDRVSVYPQFECVDISPILKVRPRPLREPRFIADAHLAGLARYLRMLGFDVTLDERLDDREVAEIGVRERRIVLTRDRELLKQRIITHGCYVHASKPRRQLEEIVSRLDLSSSMQPFTRCMECNAPLADVDKHEIRERLPPGTAEYYDRFRSCTGCRKIYWPGSHYEKMRALIEELASNRVAGRHAG